MSKVIASNSTTPFEQEVWRCIDRNYLADLAKNLVDIPSPTGQERDVAVFYRDALAEAGVPAFLQEIESERFNAIGRLKGDGSGITLMFNGHLDTSYFGAGRELPDLPGYRPKAWEQDGWLYGLGIYNMKGALACYVAAVRAIINAGVKLAGDVVIAGVAGEVEMGPIDRFQGRTYRGGGVGSRHLVTHGVTADMAIFGEPTALNLVVGHMGYVFAKVTTRGTPAHGNYGDPTDNAILKMMRLIAALQVWADDYRRTHTYRGRGATVTIGAIEGGTPFRCCRMPLECSVYVDVRIVPGAHPIDVQYALTDFLRGFSECNPEISAELDCYVTNPGVEIAESHPLTRAVAESHRTVFGEEVVIAPEGWSSDAVHLCSYGVPGLNYGPSGRTRSGTIGWDPAAGEHVAISDLLRAAKVYAKTILHLCTKPRAEVMPTRPPLAWAAAGS